MPTNREVILYSYRINLLFLIGLFSAHFSLAQAEYSTGTLLDDSGYDRHAPYDIKAYDLSLPTRYSLEEYAPKVGNQIRLPHDIGWSLASALVIAERAYLGDDIAGDQTKDMRSPYFIPMLWSEDVDVCKDPISLSKTVDKLQNTGIPLLSDYVSFCPSQIDLSVLKKYLNKDVRYFEKVFNRGADTDEKIKRIKTKLALDRPVVASFHCPPSFASQSARFWSPKERVSDEYPLHTIVITGYDDQLHGGSFQIRNSWGTKWGSNGYTWIRYEDFDFFRYAYSVSYTSPDRANSSLLTGNLSIQLLTNEIPKASWFDARGFYRIDSEESILNFIISGSFNKPFYLKLYYSTGAEISLIYPADSWRSGLFEFSYKDFDLPGDGDHYIIDDDFYSDIFIFLSFENIDDLDFTALVKTSSTINDVLNSDDFRFAREVIWTRDEMSFTGRLYDKEIIPLQIRLNLNEN